MRIKTLIKKMTEILEKEGNKKVFVIAGKNWGWLTPARRIGVFDKDVVEARGKDYKDIVFVETI